MFFCEIIICAFLFLLNTKGCLKILGLYTNKRAERGLRHHQSKMAFGPTTLTLWLACSLQQEQKKHRQQRG
jgi:hypothetical protein